MSALKVVRRLVIPAGVAAGVSIPIIFPSVVAKEEPLTRMVRPSELPIYDDPEDITEYEYYYPEPNFIEKNVRTTGQTVRTFLAQYQETFGRAVEIYETGKAHTLTSLDYLLNESNTLPRYGAIALGGLTGLLLSVRRGLFKKLLYTSVGTAAVASAFYPQQAYEVSMDTVYTVRRYSLITYNFIQGVKPEAEEATSLPPSVDVIAEQKPEKTAESQKEVVARETLTEETRSMDYTDILKRPLEASEGDIGQSNPADGDMYTTRGG